MGCISLGRCPTASPAAHALRPAEQPADSVTSELCLPRIGGPGDV